MAQTNKLPPQNIEAEQSLLGALLIDKDAIVRVGEMLHPSHFYRTEQHGRIYEAILQLYEKREPIDLVTLTERLKQNEALDVVGGSAYLTQLINMVPTAAHVEHYAQIIKDHAIRRNLITESTKLVEEAYDEAIPLDTVLDDAQQGIFSLSQQSVKRDFIALRDLLTVSFDRLDELQKTSGKLRGVPTGFRDLDNKLAGFQNSNLIIFAARPGQGKCLAYDSKIIHPQTGEVKTIEEYYQQQIRQIFTLDEHLKLTQTEVSQFVDDGLKPVYLVKTATGREIEVTLTHPFLTISGWKQLEQIKVEDKIALPRALPVFGENSLPDHQVKAMAYFIADGGLTHINPRFTNTNPEIVADFQDSIAQFEQVTTVKFDSAGTRAPSYQVKRNIDDQQAIRDYYGTSLNLVLQRDQVSQRSLAAHVGVSSSLVNMWLGGHNLPSPAAQQQLVELFPQESVWLSIPQSVQHNAVTDWLKELGLWGKNALEKQIPKVVFTLTKEHISLFLNRLFACDGTAYISREGQDKQFPVIAYASSSKALISDVQHLLLRFGILSKVRTKNIKYKGGLKQSFELEITNSEDIVQFCQQIGIFGKEQAVQQVYQLALQRQTQNNFTKDTLPVEVWDAIKQYKGEMSWAQLHRLMGLPASHNLHVGKRNPKRSTVMKIAQALQCQELMDLAVSDIFWDKIVAIKSMGQKQVYDLTIASTHNFVANDFFVHNTSFMLNVAQYVAVKAKMPVGIFSLEMSQEEIVDRLLVGQADIDAWKLKTGRLDEKDFDRLSNAMGELAEAPLYIDDTPGLSLAEIRTKARRLQMEHGLRFLMVDYLQLIHGRNQENRVQEISEISQGLKNIARELKIPVMALSQLSRAVEQRGTRKPMLADLRDSGAIEQDADVVMFIYREDPENMEDTTLDIQKHRNGSTGEIKLIFRGDRTKFYGMEKTRVAQATKKSPSAADIEKEMATAA